MRFHESVHLKQTAGSNEKVEDNFFSIASNCFTSRQENNTWPEKPAG